MTDPSEPNLDLGRPLLRGDIEDDMVMPIDERDCGVRCYTCKAGVWDESSVAPLTPSSGVFTYLVRCGMDAPVWVCLEHIPFQHKQFECFTPEVAALLERARQERDERSRAARAVAT
jgi:hypothetical protein